MMENEHQASPSSLQLVRMARFPWHPSLNGRRSFCRSKQAASNMLVALHPGAPPAPVAILGVHSSSNGLIFPETLNSATSGRRLSRSLAISRLCLGRCWPRWVLKSCASIRPLESCKNLPSTKAVQTDRLQKSTAEVSSGPRLPDSIRAGPHSTSSISES